MISATMWSPAGGYMSGLWHTRETNLDPCCLSYQIFRWRRGIKIRHHYSPLQRKDMHLEKNIHKFGGETDNWIFSLAIFLQLIWHMKNGPHLDRSVLMRVHLFIPVRRYRTSFTVSISLNGSDWMPLRLIALMSYLSFLILFLWWYWFIVLKQVAW